MKSYKEHIISLKEYLALQREANKLSRELREDGGRMSEADRKAGRARLAEVKKFLSRGEARQRMKAKRLEHQLSTLDSQLESAEQDDAERAKNLLARGRVMRAMDDLNAEKEKYAAAALEGTLDLASEAGNMFASALNRGGQDDYEREPTQDMESGNAVTEQPGIHGDSNRADDASENKTTEETHASAIGTATEPGSSEVATATEGSPETVRTANASLQAEPTAVPVLRPATREGRSEDNIRMASVAKAQKGRSPVLTPAESYKTTRSPVRVQFRSEVPQIAATAKPQVATKATPQVAATATPQVAATATPQVAASATPQVPPRSSKPSKSADFAASQKSSNRKDDPMAKLLAATALFTAPVDVIELDPD